LAALRLRKLQRDEAESTAGKAWQKSDLPFTTRYGTPIEPRNFQRSWQTRCEKAGVKPITVHRLRPGQTWMRRWGRVELIAVECRSMQFSAVQRTPLLPTRSLRPTLCRWWSACR
jgi:hypothetical protein